MTMESIPKLTTDEQGRRRTAGPWMKWHACSDGCGRVSSEPFDMCGHCGSTRLSVPFVGRAIKTYTSVWWKPWTWGGYTEKCQRLVDVVEE